MMNPFESLKFLLHPCTVATVVTVATVATVATVGTANQLPLGVTLLPRPLLSNVNTQKTNQEQ